ncbi:cytochrome P450 2U1 [Elysia marginata]|uniref:Cytochrome P450 2U1 n=1 Tax=Elysia marginata TaxID=1093978 RepID=A0AAV4FKD0_9GAST|nr:cytochrome P450 2U1 [Elysia marginata]
MGEDSIFSLYFGPDLVVVLNGYDNVHHAFIKHAEIFNDRPASLAASAPGEEPNRGIIASSGKLWKQQRTVSLNILKAFGMGKNILASKVGEEVSAYLEALNEFRGQPADVGTLTRNAVANVICSIIVGTRFEYGDPYFTKFIVNLDTIMRANGSSAALSLFPWLRYLPIPGDLFNTRKLKESYRNIMDFFFFHYMNKMKSEESGDENDNFILAYLHAREKLIQQGQDTTLDDENLARVVFELFLAGTDTTSSFFTWFIVHMVHHPDIQAKIYAEILDVVGSERPPAMQDKSKLNLIVATIHETLRINFATLNVPHQCREDTVLKGYRIPAGTTIIPNTDSLHRCETTFKDPTEFRPERFLDSEGNLVAPPNQFMPFGIGKTTKKEFATFVISSLF